LESAVSDPVGVVVAVEGAVEGAMDVAVVVEVAVVLAGGLGSVVVAAVMGVGSAPPVAA
jgi:hypothetical protein